MGWVHVSRNLDFHLGSVGVASRISGEDTEDAGLPAEFAEDSI
jgi:hypothetical protein